jgi:hypothetical protein
MATEDGGPAFGGAYDDILVDGSHTPRHEPVKMERRSRGMTLRDYFAAKALSALLTRDTSGSLPSLSSESYRWADAMLKERAK